MTTPHRAPPHPRWVAGETVLVLAAWAGVQWLSWEALAHALPHDALPAGHHEASALAGVAGGVLVILAAGRRSRSTAWRGRRSARHAAAAAVASLLVGAGHLAVGSLPHALPVLALLAVVAVAQAAAAALACLVWREAARAWHPVAVVVAAGGSRPLRPSVDTRTRVLVPLWRAAPLSSRAPPGPVTV
jgi:hypothetical protein